MSLGGRLVAGMVMLDVVAHQSLQSEMCQSCGSV